MPADSLRTHMFDIFCDFDVNEKHEVKKLNYEYSKLVGIILCKYDNKQYRITVELENAE
jgi:hypothetical protein